MKKLGASVLAIIFVVHVVVGMPRVVQDGLEAANGLGGRFYGNLLLDLAILVGIGMLGSFKLSSSLAGLVGAGYWGMTYIMTNVATSNLRPGRSYMAHQSIRVSDALDRAFPYYVALAIAMAALGFLTKKRSQALQ